jgi:hypothetical protein
MSKERELTDYLDDILIAMTDIAEQLMACLMSCFSG